MTLSPERGLRWRFRTMGLERGRVAARPVAQPSTCASRPWVVTLRQEERRAHFLPPDPDVAVCKRRRGHARKALRRLVAARLDIRSLRDLGWTSEVAALHVSPRARSTSGS